MSEKDTERMLKRERERELGVTRRKGESILELVQARLNQSCCEMERPVDLPVGTRLGGDEKRQPHRHQHLLPGSR